jgi:hypothetical protein
LKTTLSPLLFASILLILSCNKDKTPEPTPPVPNKKVYLKKATSQYYSGGRFYRLFEYDANDRLSKIIADSVTKPGNLDIEFFYDGQNRLSQTKDYGNILGPGVLQEIRRFYYDVAGNCIADSAYNEQMQHTWYWDNNHTFDSQNRLLATTTGNGTVIRYEYGQGKNPVKAYVKYNGMSELPWITDISYDNKNIWLGEDKTLVLYFRTNGSQYMADFFSNNPLQYKEAVSINNTSVLEWADVKEELQYNASGYPSYRKVTQTTPNAGTQLILEQEFEYIEK